MLTEIAKKIRINILKMSTVAGSGHPSSSLSAVELMTVLLFDGHFNSDWTNPNNSENDKLVFSKGHASPLFYSLFEAKGVLTEQELFSFRQFGSKVEGHPTMKFAFTEAATGSLGQGLGVASGMAFVLQKSNLYSKVWCLLGDSEMAEGSVWEAMQTSAYYNLSNLRAIIDVNRLGQRGETMQGHNIQDFVDKCISFGWEVFSLESGNDIASVQETYQKIDKSVSKKPKMIVAKTYKGAGVKLLENQDNWHGKALNREQLDLAVTSLK